MYITNSLLSSTIFKRLYWFTNELSLEMPQTYKTKININNYSSLFQLITYT